MYLTAVRTTILSGAFAAALFFLAVPAHANLITTPASTVNALFYIGASLPLGSPSEIEDYGSPPVAGPAPIGSTGVAFVEGAIDGSTINVGATQIVITNLLTAPFCSTSTKPCPDSFTGFQFLFSAGVSITGVSVDPASAVDFRPVSGGLQLSSPTDILVNLAGDAPSTGDELILDLSFAPATAPEPSTLVLLAAGLLAVMRFERHRR